MPKGTEHKLLERESEVAQLDAALDEAAGGRGGLIVVEAVAGLGKTRLVETALARASERKIAALAARGTELEREFAFGVVRQLLEPRLAVAAEDEREALFEGAAALSRPLFSGIDETASSPADPSYATLHGLYWLLSNLASERPLLLAIDDAQWADGASLRFLGFLLPRLSELPVALLVALRSAEPGAEREELERLLAAPEALALRPRPLSEAAVSQLAEALLGEAPDPQFAAACHRATAGNPFYLNALLGELRAQGQRPSAAHAEAVAHLGPRAISRAVLLRLSALGADAPALARALAVLGDGAGLCETAALAEIGEERAGALSDLLVRAAILRRAERLEFVHPIVREAVYADLAPRERAAAHAGAARALAGAGVQLERVAAQLLATTPARDPWVVERLREAAAEALTRGAPEVAVTFLRRALAEPPGADVRTDLMLSLGGAEAQLGTPECIAHLSEAFELAEDARRRALAARDLALLLAISGRLTEAIPLLEEAIGSLPPEERELALELEAGFAALAKMDSQAADLSRRRLAKVRHAVSGDTPAERALLAEFALQAAVDGSPADDVAHLAEEALRSPRWVLGRFADAPQYFQAEYVLVAADRFERASELLEQAVAEARAAGSPATLATALVHRSRLLNRCGKVSEAEGEATFALDLLVGGPHLLAVAMAVAFLIDALVERSELKRAEAALADLGLGAQLPDGAPYNMLLDSRGGLRLAQGRLDEALEDHLEYGRRERDWQARNPAFSAWRSRAALALAALDKPDEARGLVDEELRLARAFGAPRAIGIALRAAALVDGGEGATELLNEAVAVHERSGARVEHARALVDLGAALRRGNRRSESREPLTAGLELAQRCGATALVERAAAELEATGARPRRFVRSGIEALTPSERRIANMAAEGRSNREIAQALFVTQKTVEMHLSNTYRKLNVSARAELPATLRSVREANDPEAEELAAGAERAPP